MSEPRDDATGTPPPGWLGFLEAFRTLCVSPPAEMKVLMEKIEVLEKQFDTQKCFLAKVRPEPDLRYFSKAKALALSSKPI